jgi:uncharacterized membrane protein YhhN
MQSPSFSYFRERTIPALTFLCAVSAAIYIVGESYAVREVIYVFKPLTMVLIIAIAFWIKPTTAGLYKRLIMTGLLSSLAGDIFLMLPDDRFMPGLVCFLVAHLFYISAFISGGLRISVRWSLGPFLLYGAAFFIVLVPRLGDFKAPVSVYLLVILVMAWQALNRWSVTRRYEALLAFVGALLFVLSDSVIALDRFVQPFGAAMAIIATTYFIAQWLIACSVKQ